ncbi:hypothetical protein C8R47DRAFT_1156872 [Mycena vitilis]|nr:hypothetical protein C8R47DRAFT_1156872 [Mycena vitilis]
MPKDTSKNDPEAYLKYYPGSNSPVSPETQANIRRDPLLRAAWKARYHYAQERVKAEDSGSWSLSVPREVMDIILADPCLGVREHVALAATSSELRRLYHSTDVWSTEISQKRTTPKNGVQVIAPTYSNAPYTRRLNHLATAPQKKKANGAFFKALAERYGSHSNAITAILKHRISRPDIATFYPNLTDQHVARLRFYPAITKGYDNEKRNAGYAEVAVEWLAIRVANGMP